MVYHFECEANLTSSSYVVDCQNKYFYDNSSVLTIAICGGAYNVLTASDLMLNLSPHQQTICDVNTPAVSASSSSVSAAAAGLSPGNDLMMPVRRPISALVPAQHRPIASQELDRPFHWLPPMPRI